MNLETSLGELGLNRTEAKVYTRLLSMPKQNTAFQIAKAIKVPCILKKSRNSAEKKGRLRERSP